MSVSVVFANQPAIKHSLQFESEISQGKFLVYKVYSPTQKTDFAFKIFPKDTHGNTQYKKETIMFGLSHPNIIKSFPIASVSSDSPGPAFHALLTEFAQHGDMFELVIGGYFNSEVLIRTYFHQLIEGLEYIHKQGVAHLDLKLENLMIGTDYTLKIIDFDQAQRITDTKLTSGGTKAFRAPEVIDGSCSNFKAADIYSAGIILFAMKTQRAPFAERVTKDGEEKVTKLEFYTEFIRKNKAFWEAKADSMNDKNFFSQEFKELINGMLEFEVKKRLTIKEIKKSNWYRGPILDAKRLRAEIKSRWEVFSEK